MAVQQYSSTAVQQYGSTAVWQYSSIAVQQYGSTAVQQYSSMAVQQYSSTAVQQYGSTAVWQYSSMAVQQYGNMALQQYGNAAVCQYSSEAAVWQCSKKFTQNYLLLASIIYYIKTYYGCNKIPLNCAYPLFEPLIVTLQSAYTMNQIKKLNHQAFSLSTILGHIGGQKRLIRFQRRAG